MKILHLHSIFYFRSAHLFALGYHRSFPVSSYYSKDFKFISLRVRWTSTSFLDS